jgi:tRNA (5-methylaminomethyl-2-thiouridylate)-methyltransferase
MLLKNKKLVFVAMSGGVDSSVSALLLKQMGFDVVGVTFLLYESRSKGEGRTCCSTYDISDAERVAMKIKIPFYVMDMRDEFRKFIIENFVSEYKAGRTPIPCVHCNDVIKFKIFFEKAKKLGADFIATGHYSLKIQENGYTYISKAYDRKKDQSYFLFGLKSEQLKNILFPVGGMTKDYVRKIAEVFDLPTARKRESQDICFTEGKDWREKIKELGVQEKKGEIIEFDSGKVVGEHDGYFFFTIGQRRGLNVALGKPVYVIKLDPERNRVFVGSKENLLVKKFFVENLSFPNEEIEEKLESHGIDCVVKVRYAHEGTEAFVRKVDGKLIVVFKERFGPVVPGQACVLYKNDRVLGGGFISSVEYYYECS